MIHVLSVLTYEEALANPALGSVAAEQSERLFDTGALVMTHGVHQLVEQSRLNPAPYLQRHICGDWGEVFEEDHETNQNALKFNNRLFSCYHIEDDVEPRLWIITEADRSVTTLLLPSEY